MFYCFIKRVAPKDEINKILEKAKKKETEKQADDEQQDHSVNVDVENDNKTVKSDKRGS